MQSQEQIRAGSRLEPVQGTPLSRVIFKPVVTAVVQVDVIEMLSEAKSNLSVEHLACALRSAGKENVSASSTPHRLRIQGTFVTTTCDFSRSELKSSSAA